MKKILISLALALLPHFSHALTCEVAHENPFLNGFSFQYDYTGKILVLSLKGDATTNLKVTKQEFLQTQGSNAYKHSYLATGNIPDIGEVELSLVIDGKEGNSMSEPSPASRNGEVNIKAITKLFALSQVPVTCYEDYLSHMGKNLFVPGKEYSNSYTLFKNQGSDVLAKYYVLQKIVDVDSVQKVTHIHITKQNLLNHNLRESNLELKQDFYFNIKNIQDFCLENPGSLESIFLKDKNGIAIEVYACKIFTTDEVAKTFATQWYTVSFPFGVVKAEKYKGAPRAPLYLKSRTEFLIP